MGAEPALSGGRYGIGEMVSSVVIFAYHLVELLLRYSTGGEVYAIDLVYSDSESMGVFHKNSPFILWGAYAPIFSCMFIRGLSAERALRAGWSDIRHSCRNNQQQQRENGDNPDGLGRHKSCLSQSENPNP